MLNFEVIALAVIIALVIIAVVTIVRNRRLASQIKLISRSERHIHRLTDGLPASVFQFKKMPDGQIVRTFMNQAARELVRVENPLPSRRRSRFFEFVHRADAKNVRDSIDGSLASGKPISATFRYQFPDGEWGWVFAEASVYTDEDGALVWSGYMHDLTRERFANQALNRALESRNNLVSAISQELKLPAKDLHRQLQALLETDLELHQRDIVDSIVSIVDGIGRQTRDLIDLTQLETRDLALVDRNIDLKALLARVCAEAEASAHNKGLQFLTEIDNAVPTYIRCDPRRLKQILENLLANAIKHTANGFVRLAVQLDGTPIAEPEVAGSSELPRDGVPRRVRLKFLIRDSGVGIPADNLSRVFEPTSIAGGRVRSELNLVICERLSALMSGRITARSKLTVGTTFEVVIPVAIAVGADIVESKTGDTAPDESAATVLAPSVNGVEAQAGAILIVDDNRLARVMASALLVDSGFEVHQAEDSIEALELIAQNEFRAVITDYRMPGANGIELGLEIRELSVTGRAVPVLMLLTAGMTDREMERARTVFDAVLEKPVSTVELIRTLHTIEQTGAQVA